MANRGYALKDTDGVTTIRVATVGDAASASNVGTLRYRVDGTISYCEMSMQSEETTYEWKIIASIDWTA